MNHPNTRSIVASEFQSSPTVIMVQPPAPQAMRPSCCLIFTAVLLLITSAGELGGAGYIATKSTKLSYHYAFLVGGGISCLTSIITLYGGQDRVKRHGLIITASIFAVAGLISNMIAIVFGTNAIRNEETDCILPKCKIQPSFELTLKDFNVGGISCAWQCFENYEVIWNAMMGIAAACAFFEGILVLAACCHCLVDCCRKKKPNELSLQAIGISGPNTIAYNRLEG